MEDSYSKTKQNKINKQNKIPHLNGIQENKGQKNRNHNDLG